MEKRSMWIGSLCLVMIFACSASQSLAAAASPHPQVKIDILTATMGSEGYIMTFALSDIVNKNHPWVRLRGMETTGIAENVKTLAKEPEKRPNSVIFANTAAVYQSKMGIPPYTEKYTSLRAIASFNASRFFFVTMDPNIKTLKDLTGKKVGMFPKGSPSIIEWEAMLKYGFNIEPKSINWVPMPLGPGIDSLSDGRLAATWAGASPPPINATAPQLLALLPTRDVYFIGFSPEAAKAAREKTGFPTYVAEVPAGTYTPKQPKLFCHIQFLSWWADLSMDKDVVYEITKTIYENVGKFGDYHTTGKSMTRATISQMGDESMFHPGAVKFYKEKGMKIGMD